MEQTYQTPNPAEKEYSQPSPSSGKRASQAEKTQFNGLEYELSATLGPAQ